MVAPTFITPASGVVSLAISEPRRASLARASDIARSRTRLSKDLTWIYPDRGLSDMFVVVLVKLSSQQRRQRVLTFVLRLVG